METITAVNTSIAKYSSYDELTPILKQRSASLRVFYDDWSLILKILSYLEPRGTNSWKSTYDKAAAIGRADHKQALYGDGLYENFIVNQDYTLDEIIKNVVAVRYEMGLLPYLSNIKKSCENDFASLFMVIPVFDEASSDSDQLIVAKGKKTVIGYRPVVRLKPEEV